MTRRSSVKLLDPRCIVVLLISGCLLATTGLVGSCAKEEKKEDGPAAKVEAPAGEPGVETPGVPEAKAILGTRVAGLLPADTMLLIWSMPVGEVMEILAQVGFGDEVVANMDRKYKKLRDKLGYDLLTRAGMEKLGIDLQGPVGVGLIPAAAAELLVVFHIPTRSDVSGIDKFGELLSVAEKAKVELKREEVNGRKVAFVKPAGPEQAARTEGVLVDTGSALLVAVPAENWNVDKYGAVTQELKDFVARTTAKEMVSLATRADFGAAMEPTAGALLGVYFNPSGILPLLAGEDELAMVASSLTEIAGISAWLLTRKDSMRMGMRTILKDADQSMVGKRDLGVMELIPGRPVAGYHLAVDAEKLLKQTEKLIATDKWTWRSYRSGKEAARDFCGLNPDAELYQLWNGELGFFFDDFIPNPQLFAQGVTAFLGLKDKKMAAQILDALVEKAGGQGFARSDSEGQTIYTFKFEGMLFSAAMVGERLWFTGSPGTMEKIVKGEKGQLATNERTKKIGAVMLRPNSGAVYVDLQKLFSLLMPLMSRGDREDLAPLMPILTKLDYATMEVVGEGKVGSGETAVHITGGDFRTEVVAAGGRFVANEFNRYSRKAKTVEAIDMLDKMYKGAATYYTTPRVSEEGELLPCQFPAPARLTPGPNCCQDHGGPDKDGDGRCDASPEAWSTPTWSALYFQVVDPHYCVYSFNSAGTGGEAQFTASAHCDLDCDGIPSTFQRFGKGTADASGRECSVSSSAAMYVENETE